MTSPGPAEGRSINSDKPPQACKAPKTPKAPKAPKTARQTVSAPPSDLEVEAKAAAKAAKRARTLAAKQARADAAQGVHGAAEGEGEGPSPTTHDPTTASMDRATAVAARKEAKAAAVAARKEAKAAAVAARKEAKAAAVAARKEAKAAAKTAQVEAKAARQQAKAAAKQAWVDGDQDALAEAVQPRRHRAVGGSRGRHVARGGETHAALGMEGGSMPLARDIMLA